MESHAIFVYNHFCNDIGLDNSKDNINIMFLIFQKNIYAKESVNKLYECQQVPFIDWDQYDNIKNYKGYKDTACWIHLSQFLQMKAEELTWKQFVSSHKIFNHFVQSMQQSKLELKPIETARLFLLLNIVNLQAMVVVEMYFSMLFNMTVQKEALVFFSILANIPFDKSDRTEAIVELLKVCLQVDSKSLFAEIELHKNRESKLQQIFRQKHIQATTLRPRLRSKIRQEMLQGSALATLDSFKSWSDIIRFPNIFSVSHKKRLYFIMSQTNLDPEKFINMYVQEEELAPVILKYQVKNPDVDVLTYTILASRITSEPFSELHQFRNYCFNCFSVQQKSMLRLNDLLHLYIAAYQPVCVWKNVWKMVFPVLSIQIIKDVENFVSEKKFNDTAVMQTIFEEVK